MWRPCTSRTFLIFVGIICDHKDLVFYKTPRRTLATIKENCLTTKKEIIVKGAVKYPLKNMPSKYIQLTTRT